MVKVTELKALSDYRLWLRYVDGVEGVVDLSDYVGKGVFAAWENPYEFSRVHIGDGGQISWSDEIDFCPDALYLKITGRSTEEPFSSLHPELC